METLIDVKDMCRAIEWATIYNQKKSLNVGSNKNNFNIKDLAKR